MTLAWQFAPGIWETEMDTITVSGMVLSSMPVGEYDKRIVLLTAGYGRLSAFVRGARRPGSSLLAAARPFSSGEFTLYRGRDSYTVQSAAIREHFEALAQDVIGMAYGCYFCEAAGFCSEENAGAKDLLNLLFLSLKALENPSLPNSLVRMIFELRLYAVEGEYPQIFECSRCKTALSEGWLFVRKGSCTCAACRELVKEPNPVFLAQPVMYTLQYILTAPMNRLYTFQISREVEDALREVLERWRDRCGAREFKSLAVLEDMLQMLS